MTRLSVSVPSALMREARELLKETRARRKEQRIPGRVGLGSMLVELAFLGAELRKKKGEANGER